MFVCGLNGVHAWRGGFWLRLNFVTSLKCGKAVKERLRVVGRMQCTVIRGVDEKNGNGNDDAHVGVLTDQILDQFRGRSMELFLDGTVGAGFHASRLLQNCDIDTYLAFDQDASALELAKSNLTRQFGSTRKIEYIHSNFNEFPTVLKSQFGIDSSGTIDGMMLDLGVSSMQLDTPERGFSFRFDAPLDMRMNPENTNLKTAEFVIQTYSEEQLGLIFKEFGEEPRWRRVAASVVSNRDQLKTTKDLAELAVKVLGYRKHQKIHPATKIFQALRIEVNQELEALSKSLPNAIESLKPGVGRLCVISFHSLEDRLVKRSFTEFSEIQGGVEVLTKRPLIPHESEVQDNSRSRSAKLRVVQRLNLDQYPPSKHKNKYAHLSPLHASSLKNTIN